MTTDLVTYLSFDGQCEAAFKHYEKVLGGKILMMMRHADAPAGAGVPQSPETANRIMHARLKAGDRRACDRHTPHRNLARVPS
jgi:PhnB protein